MRRLLPLLLALLTSACAPAAARGKPKEKIVVITNVNVVDVATGNILPRLAVVIKKGRITALARHAIIQESPEIEIVNGEGKYLVPGLWDMQVRLRGGDTEQIRAQVLLPLVASGVTGVRDVGGDAEAVKELRRQIEHEGLPGPRVVTAAPRRDDPVVVVHDLQEARAAVARLQQRPGVELLLGTDRTAGAAPGADLHQTLALLVEAGLSARQAFQAATLNPARFLKKEKEMGEIEVGRLADLLLLEDDPTRDIHNLDKIAGVVLAGRYYSRRELDEMLAKAAQGAK